MSDTDDGALPFVVSEDLVPSRTQKAAGILTLDFDGLLSPPLRLQEDLKEGNGGQAWPAGMILAKFLMSTVAVDGTLVVDHHSRLHRVELGAGGGLVGLALGLALPSQSTAPIHITDLAAMLPLMRANVALNFPSSSGAAPVMPAVYSWGDAPPADVPVPPDVVLAADCVYFEPAFPLLLATLGDLIGERTVCWFCFKRRRRADMGFSRELKKMFRAIEIGVDGGWEVGFGEGEAHLIRSESLVWLRENMHLYRVERKTKTKTRDLKDVEDVSREDV